MKTRNFVSMMALAALALRCSSPDFDPSSKVQSVRILATRADKPYAKPGDTIQLELLATDARRDRSRPMTLFWVPAPCVNPKDDAYYNCYPGLETVFARDAEVDSQLVSGGSHSVRVPDDVLAEAVSAQNGTPFGTLVVFSMACAGHVRYVGTSAASPQSAPFACFDEAGARLGANDFVFAFTRLFVFADRANQNPTIEGLTFDGQPVDMAAGITIDRCTEASSKSSECPKRKVDIVVPAANQEPDPSVGRAGARESLWANYYVSDGKVGSEVRLLYDAELGKVPHSENELEAPASAGEQTLWVVVHDNRGGAAWTQVPMHVR